MIEYAKLQIGCLCVVLYIVVTYLKTINQYHISHNRYFDMIMLFAPLAIFFDGFTAWSVNHLDTIPLMVNLICHLLFFIFMNLMIIATTMYIYNQLIGFSNKKQFLFFLSLGVISLLLVVLTINQLEFINGIITNYSMGIAVYICYGTLVVNYGIIVYLLMSRYKFLPKDKLLGIFLIILIAGSILLIQILMPEVLLTAIFPTILLLAIYIEFENPYLKKITSYNSETVEAFATMVENRDNNTGGHIKRTKAYVDLILKQMRKSVKYQNVLNRDYLTFVSNAAPLHDLGKIAIPDSILQKPGKLTDEEFAKMKEHSIIGSKIILNTFAHLEDDDFKKIAYEVALYHHEKYNGKGYPNGLKGEDIPLHARIMAIADVFDAISQNRCYRKAMDIDQCFRIIEEGIAEGFDPDLAKMFINSRDEVVEVMKKFQ